jgi:hypothetical protein
MTVTSSFSEFFEDDTLWEDCEDMVPEETVFLLPEPTVWGQRLSLIRGDLAGSSRPVSRAAAVGTYFALAFGRLL